jgi:hypothetical protein
MFCFPENRLNALLYCAVVPVNSEGTVCDKSSEDSRDVLESGLDNGEKKRSGVMPCELTARRSQFRSAEFQFWNNLINPPPSTLVGSAGTGLALCHALFLCGSLMRPNSSARDQLQRAEAGDLDLHRSRPTILWRGMNRLA